MGERLRGGLLPSASSWVEGKRVSGEQNGVEWVSTMGVGEQLDGGWGYAAGKGWA